MAGKCRDGVELPDHGPCPRCGSNDWETCRGKSYAEYMKMKAAQQEIEKDKFAVHRIIHEDRRMTR